MKKILVSGCGGRMGKNVISAISERTDCKVVAGFDIVKEMNSPFPIFSKTADITVDVDVIIDFSHPSVLSDLLDYAVHKKIPIVLSTTGYSDVQVSQIHRASQEIPVFYSRNMSLGINLLISLAKKAVSILGDSFDIEIIEKHHNQKIDAPSGTALMIADAVNDERNQHYQYMFDRHSRRKKREQNEIGLHAVRGGTIVGEHEVIFAGHDEVISISHSALSKGVFAGGAVNAAVFLTGCPSGLYDMESLVNSKNG